jgi:2-dehydro-3-deoxy-D-arabinonate dehydratase
VRRLCDVLHHADPLGLARFLLDTRSLPIALAEVRLLAPVDRQEVWAAGVTYKRSQVARMEESESGASHYDKVYTADRPELFFKSAPQRVVGPGDPVRVRADSRWTVPEPELTLVISPERKVVAFTIGNDMSARDIEGENPLYLPQAKVYDGCCAIGPCVLLPERPIPREDLKITLVIERGGREINRGETDAGQMARGFDELVGWLCREYELPDGAMLLTGTGIVPPDDLTLEDGDVSSITIAGIGTLTNPVVKRTG